MCEVHRTRDRILETTNGFDLMEAKTNGIESTQVIQYISEKHGIESETVAIMLDSGIISQKGVRNELIRRDFIIAYRNPLMSVTSIYHYLAAKYDVSFSHIRFLLKK